MPNAIQNLSDEQLDGVVGGAALPPAFEKYINDRGGISFGHISTSSSPGEYSMSSGKISMKADTEEVSSYLDDMEGMGAKDVCIFKAQSKDYDVFSISQVRIMLGK